MGGNSERAFYRFQWFHMLLIDLCCLSSKQAVVKLPCDFTTTDMVLIDGQNSTKYWFLLYQLHNYKNMVLKIDQNKLIS